MKKKKTTWLSVFVFVITVITGCSKSDLPDLITNYYKIKLYDDTLADPRNQAIRIVAGNNRLFMNYCYGFDRFLWVNGVVEEPPPPRNQWMITDNEGTIIKRDSFPADLTMGDVVSLKDNGFMAILYDARQGSSIDNYQFQFFLFDQNGQKIAEDSLRLPAGVSIAGPPYDLHQVVHLTQSSNGNPLLYFEYYDQNFNPFSFAGELNTDGSFLWYHLYPDIKLTGGLSTPDGGYIFVGTDPGGYYNTLPGFVSIMKITATGDSLWTKNFNSFSATTDPANALITAGDQGNYFFCFNDVNFLVYEINASGDSLNAFVVDEIGVNVPAAIVSKDGGVFTLANEDFTRYENLSVRLNTHFICLDAGMNVTQSGLFQNVTSDMIYASCKTSDGKICCFGITQSYNKPYFKPELITVN